MDPHYFQLWLSYFGLLLASWSLNKGRFSPAVAFFATWSITLGLLSFGSIHPDFRPPFLPRSAYFYLLFAGGSFFVGVLFAHALGPVARNRPTAITPNERKESFHLPALKSLALAALAFTMLSVYRELPNLKTYLINGRLIREQLTTSTSSVSGLSALATYAALIVIPVAAVYWLRHRNIRWWMIIPLFCIAALSLISIGKFLIIFLGLTFINQFLYHRAANSTSRLRLKPILAVVVAIFSAFLVTTELRNRDEDGKERTSRSGLLFTLYDYATGYVPAFGGFYEEYLNNEVSTFPTNPDYSPENGRPGNQTFSGIYRSLAQVGLLKQSASNHYEGAFNVYSIHRDLIMDFGISGSLVGIFLIGFSITLFCRLCDLRKPRHTIMLSLLTTQMEFTLIYSLFGFIFFPLLLVVSPWLADKSSVIQISMRQKQTKDFLPKQFKPSSTSRPPN